MATPQRDGAGRFQAQPLAPEEALKRLTEALDELRKTNEQLTKQGGEQGNQGGQSGMGPAGPTTRRGAGEQASIASALGGLAVRGAARAGGALLDAGMDQAQAAATGAVTGFAATGTAEGAAGGVRRAAVQAVADLPLGLGEVTGASPEMRVQQGVEGSLMAALGPAAMSGVSPEDLAKAEAVLRPDFERQQRGLEGLRQQIGAGTNAQLSNTPIGLAADHFMSGRQGQGVAAAGVAMLPQTKTLNQFADWAGIELWK